MDNLILLEGSIIISLGIVYVIQNNKPATPVFAGGVGLLLIVSLLEFVGGKVADIGKWLLTLATFSVVTAEAPNLLSGINNAISKGQSK